jgi:hypothetical protein
MSLRIHVHAYSGYKANERPRQFCLDDDVFEIAEVEDRWYDQNAEYFKVRTVNGKYFLLRCDAQTSEWTLQSGFDGAELLARTSITLVTADPLAIRESEQRLQDASDADRTMLDFHSTGFSMFSASRGLTSSSSAMLDIVRSASLSLRKDAG